MTGADRRRLPPRWRERRQVWAALQRRRRIARRRMMTATRSCRSGGSVTRSPRPPPPFRRGGRGRAGGRSRRRHARGRTRPQPEDDHPPRALHTELLRVVALLEHRDAPAEKLNADRCAARDGRPTGARHYDFLRQDRPVITNPGLLVDSASLPTRAFALEHQVVAGRANGVVRDRRHARRVLVATPPRPAPRRKQIDAKTTGPAGRRKRPRVETTTSKDRAT